MVNYFIYAKDFSGSTGGDRHYHRNGLKSLAQFKSDVEQIKKELLDAGDTTESKIIFLHWGDECYEVDEDITILSYKELSSGNMGTEPVTIIKYIHQNYDICGEKNKIKLLYIVTDGLIDERSTEECFNLNENMHYETVVFHAFNTDLSRIDLSVAASFFKSRCLIYRNYELFDNINISEEFDYDKINVDNFVEEVDSLKSYIKLKYINKFKHDALALEGIDKLKKLRDRLFEEHKSQAKVNLDTKDKNVFLREFRNTDWYKNLNTPEHDLKVEIEKSIATLINYIVSDKKSYSFDALKFNTKFRKPVKEEPIVDVNFTAEQEIKFPDIILDDDKGIPVILLTEFNLLDKLIFHRKKESDAVSPASFNKFRATMECPLFLMDDQDISESIGYFYTLNVYKQLLENSPRTEPRTRSPFYGGLVVTDTDEFDKYNDYILSATYFDSKKIKYNIGLFYFVLWKNADKKEWMDRNVVEHFKKYVMRRISATVCKIGLSSLPLDPPLNTSLLTALWYCVELSSCIFKDDPSNFTHERLRLHYGVAHCMIEILKYFDYDLDLETIEKRRDVITHVMTLKKIPKYKERVHFILENIFKNVNGFLVSEIENPFNLHKLNYLKLNYKGLLSDDVIAEKVHLNDYVHLMHFDSNKSKDGEGTFYEICETTYRPFFTLDQGKSFYEKLMDVTKKIVINHDDDENNIEITYDVILSLELDKILSFYNLFINYVKDTVTYPTLPEYIEYISKKKKYNGDLVTIFPSNVYVIAEEVYSRYQNIVTKVDVDTFKSVCKKYVKRIDRVKAEGVFKFTEYKEVEEFVSLEEFKVSLIRPIESSAERKLRAKRKATRDLKRRCLRGRGSGMMPRLPGRGRGHGSGRGSCSGRRSGIGNGRKNRRGKGRGSRNSSGRGSDRLRSSEW